MGGSALWISSDPKKSTKSENLQKKKSKFQIVKISHHALFYRLTLLLLVDFLLFIWLFPLFLLLFSFFFPLCFGRHHQPTSDLWVCVWTSDGQIFPLGSADFYDSAHMVRSDWCWRSEGFWDVVTDWLSVWRTDLQLVNLQLICRQCWRAAEVTVSCEWSHRKPGLSELTVKSAHEESAARFRLSYGSAHLFCLATTLHSQTDRMFYDSYRRFHVTLWSVNSRVSPPLTRFSFSSQALEQHRIQSLIT